MAFENVLAQGKKTSTEQTDLVHRVLSNYDANVVRYAQERGCDKQDAVKQLNEIEAARINNLYKSVLNPDCKIVGASMGNGSEHLFVKRKADENVYVVNPSTGKIEGHYDKNWKNYKGIKDKAEPSPNTLPGSYENLKNKQGATIVDGGQSDPKKVILAKDGVPTDGFIKNGSGSYDHRTFENGTWKKANDCGVVTQLQVGSDGSLAYSSKDQNGNVHVHKVNAQGVRQEWWTHPSGNDPLAYVIINDGSRTTTFSHWLGNPSGNVYYEQNSDPSAPNKFFQVEYNAATRTVSYQQIEGPTNLKPTGTKQTFSVADVK